MALNMLYKYTESLVRPWPVAAGTVEGKAVVSAAGQAGVTLTARGDVEWPDGTRRGGIGNRDDEATVATDGTFIFPVTGVVGGTVKNTKVYLIAASGLLTLTNTGNVLFGVTDGYNNTAAATAVKIGGVLGA